MVGFAPFFQLDLCRNLVGLGYSHIISFLLLQFVLNIISDVSRKGLLIYTESWLHFLFLEERDERPKTLKSWKSPFFFETKREEIISVVVSSMFIFTPNLGEMIQFDWYG